MAAEKTSVVTIVTASLRTVSVILAITREIDSQLKGCLQNLYAQMEEMSMMFSVEDLNQHYLEVIKNDLNQEKIATNCKAAKSDSNKAVAASGDNVICETNSKSESNLVKSNAKKAVKNNVEVVVFESKKKSRENSQGQFAPEKVTEPSKEERLKSRKLLKKLQFDVASYGLKGFSIEDKRNLEQKRAIELGAKPKKKEYVNYKVLMEEKKKRKLAEESKLKEEGEIVKRKKKKAKQTNNPLFWQESNKVKTFGQVGNYKGGVLKLSKSDIKSIKLT